MLSPLDVLLTVSHAFERLGIDYVVVGSFASSARGHARATADVDLIADLRLEHVAPIASALGPEFYVEEPAIRRAIAGYRSFNLVHLDSMFTVDVSSHRPPGSGASSYDTASARSLRPNLSVRSSSPRPRTRSSRSYMMKAALLIATAAPTGMRV